MRPDAPAADPAGLPGVRWPQGLAGLPLPLNRSTAAAGTWVGAQHERGHRLRDLKLAAGQPAVPARPACGDRGRPASPDCPRRAADASAGVDDVHLLELEDSAGGNSRGHEAGRHGLPAGRALPAAAGTVARGANGCMRSWACCAVNWAAPWPTNATCATARRSAVHRRCLGRRPAAAGRRRRATAQQYRRFAQALRQVQAQVWAKHRAGGRGARAFALPAHRSVWTPTLAALNGADLRQPGWRSKAWTTPACAGTWTTAAATTTAPAPDTVSAWAGLHYFASRHGFHAPGEDSGERDAVFTWPQGNAWLAQQLATPLQGRLHTGRTVLRVTEGRHARAGAGLGPRDAACRNLVHAAGGAGRAAVHCRAGAGASARRAAPGCHAAADGALAGGQPAAG
jgi:hypothetical protein